MTLGKLDISSEVGENAEKSAALEAATTEIDTIADWYARLVKLREMKRDVTEREKEASEFIKGWLRDRGAEFGEVDGRLAIRRRVLVKRVLDTKALRSKEPELAEKYTVDRPEERLELIEP